MIKRLTVFRTSSEALSQEMAQQHFSTLLYLIICIPSILCIHIASMWQALRFSEALPVKHPAPSFLSQACSGHNELAAASSAYSQLLCPREKVHACYMIQFPVCVASILTIHRFIDVFNVFLFGSDGRRQKGRSVHVQRNIKTRHRASSCQPFWANGCGILQRR